MTEMELYNFGVLQGWLLAIARFNDKTNNGHELVIVKHAKEMGVIEFGNSVFSDVAEDIELKEVTALKLVLIKTFGFWFYQYQVDNPLKEYYLEDKNNKFSLSDDEWKTEWVEEFVDLLFLTLKPVSGYRVSLNQMKKYYCNASDDFILESESYYFRIHCCLTD